MSLSVYILIWLVPSMLVSIAVGAYVGFNHALRWHGRRIADERKTILLALQHVLASAEELSSEVDSHNTQLESFERQVGELQADGVYEEVKRSLLHQITSLIESNKRLEDDLVCSRYNLQQQAQELDRTRREALTDSLSGVGNRKAFEEGLEFMLSQAHREHRTFALVLIDVDHFKWINDTHGHLAGDTVVRRLGEMFCSVLRPSDRVARYGGDEFAILLDRVDRETAFRVAQRLRETVERENFGVDDDTQISVTLSIGVAISTLQDTADTLLQRADQALYQSKHQGRNRLTLEGDIAPHDSPTSSADDAHSVT